MQYTILFLIKSAQSSYERSSWIGREEKVFSLFDHLSQKKLSNKTCLFLGFFISKKDLCVWLFCKNNLQSKARIKSSSMQRIRL